MLQQADIDQRFDVIIAGGRVVDPHSSVDGIFDVGILGDRIIAVEPQLRPQQTTTVVDAAGAIVCPGLVDLHTHVFEYGTDLGFPVEDAGVDAGVTTVVDMGSTGTWLFPAFRANVMATSCTEVLAFINILFIGIIETRGAVAAFSPEFTDAAVLSDMHQQFPTLIRGIKTLHESGSHSRWAAGMLTAGREAGDLTGLPLYIHTGELLPVVEDRRPEPESLMPMVLEQARPGDILAHCYSGMPDGVLGTAATPGRALVEAVEAGVRLDIGHGLNFSFDTARRMMDGGLLPFTISSDVHAKLGAIHDLTTCSYSLVGTMSKLLALGMSLHDVVAGTTCNPATVLGMTEEIGTLRPGSRADLTILESRRDDWVFVDSSNDLLATTERLVPQLVIRAGKPIVPTRRMLRDVLTPEERGEAGLTVAVGGRPAGVPV